MTEQMVAPATEAYQVVRDELVTRDDQRYRRVLARTPWFTGPTDLADVLRTALGDQLREMPGATVFICEKVAVVATGRTVSASTIKAGRLARLLARLARPRGEDVAQRVPERRQFMIERIGLPRILVAVAAAAVTRPFGIRGAFYLVAGREARSLDGMHGRYADILLPPLKPREARDLVADLAAKLGAPVAIVDINDRGGDIRAISPGGLPARQLQAALSDNPMGQSEQSTPIGIVGAA